MATKTQLEIIAYLLNQEDPQTIRGTAKNLSKSYPLVYNNIRDLERKEILLLKDAPPAKIITINPNAPLGIIISAETRRKEEFIRKNKWLQVFLNDVLSQVRTTFFCLLVFGGYAKGKQTGKSDLDILAIVPAGSIKDIESAIRGSYTKVRKHITVIGEDDFVEMIQKPQQLNVGNEAVKHHVVLYGIEQYGQLVRRT